MGGKREFRGLTWRVLLPLLIAAPIVGVMGAQVVGAVALTPGPASPAASSRPSTGAGPSAVASHRGPHVATGSTAWTFGPPPLTAPSLKDSSLRDSTPGPPSYIADPSTENQVAQDLMATIDTQSKGLYAIAATADNVALIDSWMDNEGGLWADNPLNTSLDAGRYPHQITTAGQNTGIPIFPTIEAGIAATATTLLSNHAYAGILAVLDQGAAACGDFARAVIDSPWAASHYGHDPARFCGASAGDGSVPVVTACLRLPGHSNHGVARATRMPAACGHGAARAPRRTNARKRTAASRGRGTPGTPARPHRGSRGTKTHATPRHGGAAPVVVHHGAHHRR